jgi:hypothetical protein
MRTLRRVITPVFLLLSAVPLVAQQAPRFSGQAILGLAHRTPANFSTAETDGFQALARVGYGLLPHMQLIGEVSLARYGGQRLISPSILCPVGTACLPSLQDSPGLALAGFSVGLQPHVEVGTLRLMVGATAGGYWLYHHDTGMPGAAPGVRGTLGLGLPIGGRLHILLEGSALRLLGSGVSQANSHNFGIGVAVN